MLKRFVLVICVLAVAACVEAPESSSTSPTGSDMGTSDLGGDDAEADARAEPDLSGCECAPIIGQVLSSCEDECQYTCAEGFNQCPGEDLVCVPDDVDDPSNGTDDNCDGVVGIVDDAVFVSADGFADDDNDGLTGLSPVRTLSRAVEVLEAEDRTRLILQRGNYFGNLVVDSSFQIEGGWTIDNGIWSPAQGTRSTITGDDAERPTLTISLDQPTESVTLSNVELRGADTESPGQSVFTLFIRGVQDPDQLVVDNVLVVGGTAGDGEDGADGALGEDGADGSGGARISDTSDSVSGGAGGQPPACGAPGYAGGKGGDAKRNGDEAQSGSDGDGSDEDGSPGGVGGDGGCNANGNTLLNGCRFSTKDGETGARGNKGPGGAWANQVSTLEATIELDGEFPAFVPRSLRPGEDGKGGAGGGGGGGGGSVQGEITGPSGGGGGAGGCGGGGGAAGQQGGASVAILVQDSRVDLSTVEVKMGQAGEGGAGGNGAAGGCGGSGGPVFSAERDSGSAGAGGNGGPGGNGAGGDGAPGGPSYGVYVVGQSITAPESITKSTPARSGDPGRAGMSMDNCGQAEAVGGQEGKVGAVEEIFSSSE